MRKMVCSVIGIWIAMLLTAQADVLVNYDFENYTAGAVLGGSVGTARVNTSSELGPGFDFDDNAAAADVTTSVLGISDPADFNRTGANVRSDTVAATTPGGNFLEIYPARVTDQSYGDIVPEGTVDYLSFSIQPVEGQLLNLSSFSFKLGVARGASDAGSITFRGQGWYSLDDGATWAKVSNIKSLSNTAAESFTGFSTYTTSLTDVSELQEVSGSVKFALSLSDNSGRSPYGATSVNPAAYYMDDIKVEGTTTEDSTLPAGLLTRFNFENHSAGVLVSAPVGTPRLLSGRGDIFSYNANGAASNITVSALSEVGPSDLDDTVAAYVCEDTLAIIQPGGNFLGWSPHRLRTTADDGDIDPSITDTNDSLQFTVFPGDGKALNIDELSVDVGCVVASLNPADTNEVIFRVQGWYSLDGGTNWAKVQETQLNTTTNRQSFSGFTTYSADLSGISELQGVAGDVVFALGVNNNSSRYAHVAASTNGFHPAEFYMDNINLYGAVADLPAATPISGISIDGSNLILNWDSLVSFNYNILTNNDLVSGQWGTFDTVPGTGGDVSWTSTVDQANTLFYKLERAD